MTVYAGETVVLKVSATDIDDSETPLTSADVTSTEVVIVDSAGSTVQAADPMVWDATDQEWRYYWDTPVTADTFTARIRLIAATWDTWEYQKIKTKAQPSGF